MRLWHRFRALFSRSRHEREMAEEMQAHLDGLAERNVAAGMSPEEARFAALRAFGGVEQIKERARDERRLLWIEQLAQDLRYAVRSLARSPAFTLTAVLTLALGIGVNAGLFSLFNMIALKSLPVKDPDRLVRIAGLNSEGSLVTGFTYAEYLAYREGSRALDGVLASAERRWSFQREDEAERAIELDGGGLDKVKVELVSDNYFEVLGAAMQFGRGFQPEEFRTGAPVVVLSHAFWLMQLQGDPHVLGTSIRLDRQLYTVIGVAPERFTGQRWEGPAAWVPCTLLSNRPEGSAATGPQPFRLIGRLRRGVTEAQCKADLDAMAARWAADFPGENAKRSVYLKRGLRFRESNPTPQGLVALGALFFGFGLVLVIACVNVANLLFARSASRQAEISIRLALGASRGRIIRQLLTENGLVCVMGTALGLGLGVVTLKLVLTGVLPRYIPVSLLLALDPMPDWHVLGFAAMLALGTTLAAGLLPALYASRGDLRSGLHHEGVVSGRLTPRRLQQMLLIVQVAVCLMLLSCAGVLARNVYVRKSGNRGYDAQSVFPAILRPNASIADKGMALRQALEFVRAIPGVAGVGLVDPPLYNVPNGVSVRIQVVGTAPDGAEQKAQTAFITGDFLDTLGLPLRRGRNFQSQDQHSGARVIIVSESLARSLWPGQDAVGKTLAVSEAPWKWGEKSGQAVPESFRECEVVGIAADAELQAGDESNRRLLYLSFPLDAPTRFSAYVRLQSSSVAAHNEIERVAQAGGLGLQINLSLARLMEEIDQSLYGMAMLGGALGALALAMASVGLYGMMTFVVSQRVREIGVRIALGATAGKVVALFLRQSMRLIAIGFVLGLAGASFFALLLDKILIGFRNAFDPLAFAAVTLLFAMIAGFASWLPARRAAKVDPMVALRCE